MRFYPRVWQWSCVPRHRGVPAREVLITMLGSAGAAGRTLQVLEAAGRRGVANIGGLALALSGANRWAKAGLQSGFTWWRCTAAWAWRSCGTSGSRGACRPRCRSGITGDCYSWTRVGNAVVPAFAIDLGF